MPVRAKRLDLIPPYLFGEIARLKAAARAEGKDLIDFGIGDPDQPTPTPIIDRLYEEAKNPETHCYDESDAGDPIFLKQAAQWFYNRYGVEVTTDQMVLLIGSKEGLAHLCWAYIDPGDIALIPDPNYTVPKVQTLLAGGQPYLMPLTIENNFLPDLTAIPTDVAKAAKLLFLNYPHNPTGDIWTREQLVEVATLARRHGVIVISDEIWAPLTLPGRTMTPYLSLGEDLTGPDIALVAASKAFNLAGLKSAQVIAGSDETMRLLTERIPIEVTYSAGHLGVIASIAAYREGDTWLDATRESIADNAELLGRLLADQLPAIEYTPGPSTYLAWLDCRGLGLGDDPAGVFLERGRVALNPGADFGTQGAGFARLNLATTPEILAEAVRRMTLAAAP